MQVKATTEIILFNTLTRIISDSALLIKDDDRTIDTERIYFDTPERITKMSQIFAIPNGPGRERIAGVHIEKSDFVDDTEQVMVIVSFSDSVKAMEDQQDYQWDRSVAMTLAVTGIDPLLEAVHSLGGMLLRFLKNGEQPPVPNRR